MSQPTGRGANSAPKSRFPSVSPHPRARQRARSSGNARKTEEAPYWKVPLSNLGHFRPGEAESKNNITPASALFRQATCKISCLFSIKWRPLFGAHLCSRATAASSTSHVLPDLRLALGGLRPIVLEFVCESQTVFVWQLFWSINDDDDVVVVGKLDCNCP